MDRRHHDVAFRSIARLFAWVAPVALAGALLTLAALPAAPTAATTSLDGEVLFRHFRCDLCHGVSTAGIQPRATSEKMRGPDLVDLADRRSADWLLRYKRGDERIDGKKHEPAFTGSDEELGALVSWLLRQKR